MKKDVCFIFLIHSTAPSHRGRVHIARISIHYKWVVYKPLYQQRG